MLWRILPLPALVIVALTWIAPRGAEAGPPPCRSDADCVVSCTIAGSCCGELCHCNRVYHRNELAQIEAANRAKCMRRRPRCPVADCAKPITVPRAMCNRSGKCVAVRVPWGTRMVDGFLSLPGSPPPRACKVASDCVGDTVPLASACCNDPRTLRAQSRAYKRYVNRWRTSPSRISPSWTPECSRVQCRIPPPPSRPRRCKLQMRCVRQQCTDSCRR